MATEGTEDTEEREDEGILVLCDRVREIAFALHTSLRHALLINFGSARIQFKKLVL